MTPAGDRGADPSEHADSHADSDAPPLNPSTCSDPPTEVLPRITMAECSTTLGGPEPTELVPDPNEREPHRGELVPHRGGIGAVRSIPRLDRNSMSLVQEVSHDLRPVGSATRWWQSAGGLVRQVFQVGEAARLRARAEHAYRVQHPLAGDHRIAIVSLKGGVGKTTTTAAVGSMLASLRGDRVIAVDASPDFGTLAFRGPNDNSAGVKDLLAADAIERYSDVRRFTSQTDCRLEFLASQRDPASSETLSADGYCHLIDILHRYYNIVLTDCGTGLAQPVMKAVLDETDVVIVVTTPAMDGATCAATTLDWLSCNGYGYLAETAVIVIDAARRGITPMDTDRLVGFFRSRARAAHVIPYDKHLAEGGEVALNLMHRTTYDRVLELAASLASAFPTDHVERRRQPATLGHLSAGIQSADDVVTDTD